MGDTLNIDFSVADVARLKESLQQLCAALKMAGEDTVILMVNKENEIFYSHGSSAGLAFLDSYPDIAAQFQRFCKTYMHVDTINKKINNITNDDKVMGVDSHYDSDTDIATEDTDPDSLDNLMESVQTIKASTSGIKAMKTCYCRSRKHKHNDKLLIAPNSNMYANVRTLKIEKQKKKKDVVPDKLLNIDLQTSDTSIFEDKVTLEFLECKFCGKEMKTESGLQSHEMTHEIERKKEHEEEFRKIDDECYRYKMEVAVIEYINEMGQTISGQRLSMFGMDNIAGTDTYFCKICTFKSPAYSNLYRHLETHFRKALFGCPVCQKEFIFSRGLTVHMRKHVNTELVCTKCHMVFGSKQEFDDHEKSHKLYSCQVCVKKYTTLGRYNRHLKTHGPRCFQCEDCGTGFTNKSLLKQHKLRHGPKLFFCDSCDASFYFVHQYKHHIVTHEVNCPRYKCHACSKEYLLKANFKDHLKTHDGSTFCRCDECGKSYNSKNGLRLHKMSTHTLELNFICQTCGKGFYTSAKLRAHLQMHDYRKLFKCDFCDREFRKKIDMHMHENTHTHKEKFVCDVCGSEFYNRPSFRLHRKKHIPGYNRWRCRYCQERFRTQSKMMIHVKHSHALIDLTNSTPLLKKCKECGRLFCSSQPFKIHMDMHAGIKRHKCRICGKMCTDPSNLRVHMRVHGAMKRSFCFICQTQFSDIKEFDRHLQCHENSDNLTTNHVICQNNDDYLSNSPNFEMA